MFKPGGTQKKQLGFKTLNHLANHHILQLEGLSGQCGDEKCAFIACVHKHSGTVNT
jgi:hypothetical protein